MACCSVASVGLDPEIPTTWPQMASSPTASFKSQLTETLMSFSVKHEVNMAHSMAIHVECAAHSPDVLKGLRVLYPRFGLRISV